MTLFLLLLATLAFALNLNAPAELSDVPAVLLILEYIGVLAIANILIRKGLHASKEAKNRYMNCFLIGFTISLLFLYFVWTPGLPESSRDWGFDPQRYYLYSSSVVRGEPLLTELNYFGVVFFYVFIFFIFGIDPLIPLFVNALLILYAVVLVSNHFKGIGGKDKYFSLLLLIPEVLYFNVMSSREIICLSFATISLLKGYKLISGTRGFLSILAFFLPLLLLIVIRPPMGAGLILAIGLFLVIGSGVKLKKKQITLLALLGCIFIAGLSISSSLDTNGQNTGDNISESIEERVEGNVDAGGQHQFQSNSMAKRLIPHNTVEFVIFGFIRAIAYVILPPSVITNPTEVLVMDTPTTECFVHITSLLLMLCIPKVWKVLRKDMKGQPKVKVVGFAFVVFFFLVGYFNVTMIHQRYRLTWDLFYFALVAYNYSIHKHKTIKNADSN